MTTETDGFYTRLARAQSMFALVDRDKRNKFLNSPYASYASIREAVIVPLTAENIAVAQIVEPVDREGYWLGVRTIFRADDGEFDAGRVEAPVKSITGRDGRDAPVDAMAYGATLTYLRRYGLELAAGIGRDESENDLESRPPAQAPKQTMPPRITWRDVCANANVTMTQIAAWLGMPGSQDVGELTLQAARSGLDTTPKLVSWARGMLSNSLPDLSNALPDDDGMPWYDNEAPEGNAATSPLPVEGNRWKQITGDRPGLTMTDVTRWLGLPESRDLNAIHDALAREGLASWAEVENWVETKWGSENVE